MGRADKILESEDKSRTLEKAIGFDVMVSKYSRPMWNVTGYTIEGAGRIITVDFDAAMKILKNHTPKSVYDVFKILAPAKFSVLHPHLKDDWS